jgi:hypothetical protein
MTLPDTVRRLYAHATFAFTTSSRMLSYLLTVRATVAYAVVLAAVAVTLLALGPHAHDTAVSQMSTNLHNLARGHLDTLVGSAFVTDDDDVYLTLPGLMCLLALGELVWRSGRLIAAFALGHVGATLIVAVGLAVAVEVGWQPISVADATDVGISYGAAGVLGALTAVIPSRLRPAWIGWWLGTALVAASGADFTSVGHLLALLLGMGLSVRLGSPVRWTPLRVVLLAVAVAFGYLILTGSMFSAPAGGLAGMLVALVAQRVARRWRARSSWPEAKPARSDGFQLCRDG